MSWSSTTGLDELERKLTASPPSSEPISHVGAADWQKMRAASKVVALGEQSRRASREKETLESLSASAAFLSGITSYSNLTLSGVSPQQMALLGTCLRHTTSTLEAINLAFNSNIEGDSLRLLSVRTRHSPRIASLYRPAWTSPLQLLSPSACSRVC